jgi:RNA polymerase sigma factor (sigma-70 family)
MPTGVGQDGKTMDFLRGDPSAVDEVRRAVQLAVRGFRFADETLNRDLAQEAVTRVFLNLRSGRFRGDSSLRTYAGRVARYTCLEHLRRKRREIELDAESVPSPSRWSRPEESLFRAEEHLRNLEAFASLPRHGRELLRMVFIDGLSHKEIALRLGISVAAIKTRVHRCRLVLKKALGETEPIAPVTRKKRAVRCE